MLWSVYTDDSSCTPLLHTTGSGCIADQPQATLLRKPFLILDAVSSILLSKSLIKLPAIDQFSNHNYFCTAPTHEPNNSVNISGAPETSLQLFDDKTQDTINPVLP